MQTAPEIIYKDADLIAINKPSGWLSIPDRHDAELYSVKSWFEAKGEKIFIVHRIDRDTAGLVLFSVAARQEVLRSLRMRRLHVTANVLVAVLLAEMAPPMPASLFVKVLAVTVAVVA